MVGRQRVERHDDVGPRPTGQMIDQPGVRRDRCRDVAAAVQVDDDRARRRPLADVIDGHAGVLAPLQVVEEASPGREGDGAGRLGAVGQTRDPLGRRNAGRQCLDRPDAVLRQARRGRAAISLAGVKAEGPHRQAHAGRADGDPAPAESPGCLHDSSTSQGLERGPKSFPDPGACLGYRRHLKPAAAGWNCSLKKKRVWQFLLFCRLC